MQKLKGNGWAVKFDGTMESVRKLFAAMYDEDHAAKITRGIHYALNSEYVIVVVPGLNGTRQLSPGQWLTYHEREYSVVDEIDPLWILQDDGLTKLSRAIWADWQKNPPYLGR